MPRKKWTPQTTESLPFKKSREKRKWQIALRRYVLERNPCVEYASFFGLDIENLRKWFESQFIPGIGWDDFGKKWQFDHVVSPANFEFSQESELRLCWNFVNLRVRMVESKNDREVIKDYSAARHYFQRLFESTQYEPCSGLLLKIESIEKSPAITTDPQQEFILRNKEYLNQIKEYSAFEFQLLNSGRDFEEVKKEIEFLKKF